MDVVLDNPAVSGKDTPLSLDARIKVAQRPLTIDDVRQTQACLSQFRGLKEKEGNTYLLRPGNFYEFLVSQTFSSYAVPKERLEQFLQEQPKTLQPYDDLFLSTYLLWRENVIKHTADITQKRPQLIAKLGDLSQLPNPKTAKELRDTYREHPKLNGLAGISYQDGLQEKGMRANPFVHIQGHRLTGYTYEPPPDELRLYLNPPEGDVPTLVGEFIYEATIKDVPFYLKYIDFSIQKPTRDEILRMDRLLFYTSKRHVSQVAGIIEHIRKKHPQAFANRPIPPLTAEIIEGVGFAENPSRYQREHFARNGEKNVSFNEVRAEFLRDVWIRTAHEVVVSHASYKLKNGQTMQEAFKDRVEKRKTPRYKPGVLDDEAKQVMEDALLDMVVDVFPDLPAESLFPYVAKHVQQKARKYDINPNNLAFNGNYY